MAEEPELSVFLHVLGCDISGPHHCCATSVVLIRSVGAWMTCCLFLSDFNPKTNSSKHNCGASVHRQDQTDRTNATYKEALFVLGIWTKIQTLVAQFLRPDGILFPKHL